MMNTSYKDYHEAYLSNLKGTSLLDVPLLLTVVIFLGFFAMYVKCIVGHSKPTACFVVETIVFTLPIICLVTYFNDFTPLVFCLISPPAVMLILYEVFIRQSKVPFSAALNVEIAVQRRPFVTNFKAAISLMTVISILAVDFTIFPQKYAKTEKYGYSLMDTGVGFYVVANGMTATSSDKNWLKKSLVSNVPIMILGCIRYMTVETINYQKHVSEYGVHWNFFFTLAFVKLFGAVLMAKVPTKLAMTSVSLVVAHQAALSSGLETWVISDAPRTSLLSANREGVVSLPGNLALYLSAVCLGLKIVKNNLRPTVGQELRKSLKCFAAASALLVAVSFLAVHLPPSRRLANATFVLWMFAISLQVLALSIALESLFAVISSRRNADVYRSETLYILEAISANNLFFFLIGNLLTGAVNICMQTLFVAPLPSMALLSSYTAVTSGIMCVIYTRRWKLKYW